MNRRPKGLAAMGSSGKRTEVLCIVMGKASPREVDNDLLLNTFQLLLEKDRGHRKDPGSKWTPEMCREAAPEEYFELFPNLHFNSSLVTTRGFSKCLLAVN